MKFKLFGSGQNKRTQEVVALASKKFPEMPFCDIDSNPNYMKEYMRFCIKNKDGSPCIAEYECREPYVTEDCEIFLNSLED